MITLLQLCILLQKDLDHILLCAWSFFYGWIIVIVEDFSRDRANSLLANEIFITITGVLTKKTRSPEKVFTWGLSSSGQCGHGDPNDVPIPKAIRSLSGKSVKLVSCAEHHSAAVSEQGILYTWGRGHNGRLGHGCTTNELSPKPVESLFGQHVVQASCGDFHTMCVVSTPKIAVYTWGLGLNGRLGHGDEADRLVPMPISVEGLGGVESGREMGIHFVYFVVSPAEEEEVCGEESRNSGFGENHSK